MSYVWFNSVLEALGKKVNFESISNLYGNAFAKDAGKIITAANPLVKTNGKNSGAGIAGLMGQIKIINSKDNAEAARKAETEVLGDLSWAEGLM